MWCGTAETGSVRLAVQSVDDGFLFTFIAVQLGKNNLFVDRSVAIAMMLSVFFPFFGLLFVVSLGVSEVVFTLIEVTHRPPSLTDGIVEKIIIECFFLLFFSISQFRTPALTTRVIQCLSCFWRSWPSAEAHSSPSVCPFCATEVDIVGRLLPGLYFYRFSVLLVQCCSTNSNSLSINQSKL